MLVLTDKVLRQAGLDFATAKALLAPADAELVVHIRQELDPFSSRTTADPDAGQPGPCLDSGTARLNTGHDVPVEPQATPAAQGKTSEGRSDAATVEDHGYSLGTAKKLAAVHDMTLTEAGGLYTLESAFGRQPYTSLAEAVAVIKQFARWRVAVRQSIDQTRRL